jgi:hypothetical protein
MAETSFNEQKNLSTNKLDLNLRKKPVKYYIWNTALYGVVSGYFGKKIRNIWKVLKRGAGEGWRRSFGSIV